MKNKILFSVIILSSFIGCTPVKFYSNQELTKETGLKFYTVKPFLQVEREPESGRIVKSVILYLPDLSNPQYMAVKNGPGAAKVDIKLTDGILSAFGYDYEQMVPETIESLATLLSKGAAAAEDISGLKGNNGLRGQANTIELYEIVFTPEKTFLRQVVSEK